MAFEARYPGTCVLCEERIRVGDLITYTLDDDVAHDRCPAEAQAGRAPEVCGQCWLTKPCGCEG